MKVHLYIQRPEILGTKSNTRAEVLEICFIMITSDKIVYPFKRRATSAMQENNATPPNLFITVAPCQCRL